MLLYLINKKHFSLFSPSRFFFVLGTVILVIEMNEFSVCCSNDNGVLLAATDATLV